METHIKTFSQTKSDFKTIQKNNLILSICRTGQVFHLIDIKHLTAGIFYHAWIGHRTDEQVKEVLNGHFMDIYSKHKCTKMITDISKMSGTFSTIDNWLSGSFMPKMVSLGLMHNAVIFPESIYARINIENLDLVAGGIQNRYFVSLEDASDWLRRV